MAFMLKDQKGCAEGKHSKLQPKGQKVLEWLRHKSATRASSHRFNPQLKMSSASISSHTRTHTQTHLHTGKTHSAGFCTHRQLLTGALRAAHHLERAERQQPAATSHGAYAFLASAEASGLTIKAPLCTAAIAAAMHEGRARAHRHRTLTTFHRQLHG
eukprot:559835-Pelagomonas_calceolata.AAC.3